MRLPSRVLISAKPSPRFPAPFRSLGAMRVMLRLSAGWAAEADAGAGGPAGANAITEASDRTGNSGRRGTRMAFPFRGNRPNVSTPARLEQTQSDSLLTCVADPSCDADRLVSGVGTRRRQRRASAA